MNWVILLPLVLVVLCLNILPRISSRFKLGMLAWFAVLWCVIFCVLSFGFSAPLPSSIIHEYMIIATMALLVYVGSDKKRLADFKEPLFRFMTVEKYRKPLWICVLLVPILVGIKIYFDAQVEIIPPHFSRSVHPAPPASINFKGQNIDLLTMENPLRKLSSENPEKFKTHLSQGKKIYYQNCFYCHGDTMDGNGLYAHGLDPLPTNFLDPANIGMLTEAFLFWRIAKGGIGLPDEAAPWNSAMPAWENFLNEEEIWSVILYLYDYTGNKPRAIETHE